MNEIAVQDPEVLEGVVADLPKPSLVDGLRAVGAAARALGDAYRASAECLRAALAPLRSAFHRVPHPRSAKCQICNPRGNPPPAPWTADYRRKTRRRNRR